MRVRDAADGFDPGMLAYQIHPNKTSQLFAQSPQCLSHARHVLGSGQLLELSGCQGQLDHVRGQCQGSQAAWSHHSAVYRLFMQSDVAMLLVVTSSCC